MGSRVSYGFPNQRLSPPGAQTSTALVFALFSNIAGGKAEALVYRLVG